MRVSLSEGDSFAALAPLRLGCVQYLNAKPLIHAYASNAGDSDGGGGAVVFEHPSRLAEMLARGGLDAALVPVFEALRHPRFRAVDGVSISSRGAVYSVFLAHQSAGGCLNNVRSIALDPASRTSTHLLKVLLAEYHGLAPEYIAGGGEKASVADARLLIGDQAIRFRAEQGAAFEYLDLGEEWLRRTGLPFVFAVWLIRPESPGLAAVADALRAVKRAGIAQIGEIARAQADSAFAERYLREHIRFDLGAEEKAGIEKFRELLVKHGFLPAASAPLQFA